jgi:hypothetical protein
MTTPRIILQGSVKETSRWISLARKWARQLENSGIPRKVWDVGAATITVDNYGSGLLRAVIRAVGVASPPPPPDETTRNFGLYCDSLDAAYAEGFVKTVDIWDTSSLPDDMTVSFYYSATLPTQFVIEHNGATLVTLDVPAGGGDVYDFLLDNAADSFTVTAQETTGAADAWYYEVFVDCGGGGGGGGDS